MGEIIEFPGPKKEVLDDKKSEKEISIEEKNAINLLSKERFDFMLAIKRITPIKINSDSYRNAVDGLRDMSNIEIAQRINDASELDIKKWPVYYTIAFNKLLA